jgi:shikimate kinase
MGLSPNVILVGFMGSGKTSTGLALAGRLGFRFVDMDGIIEEREGMTVSGVFHSRGEPYFREKERALVEEVARGSRQVVATGGGAWMNETNRQCLMKNGWCVWLKVSSQQAWERIRKNIEDRPLLASSDNPLKTIGELLGAREPSYASTHDRVETDGLTPEAVAELILIRLREVRPFDLPELQV